MPGLIGGPSQGMADKVISRLSLKLVVMPVIDPLPTLAPSAARQATLNWHFCQLRFKVHGGSVNLLCPEMLHLSHHVTDQSFSHHQLSAFRFPGTGVTNCRWFHALRMVH